MKTCRHLLILASRLHNSFAAGLLAMLALMLASGTGCRQAPPRLNLMIWSAYFDPEIAAAFEREFHCKVNIDFYDENEALMAKLASGGAGLYDVVAPSTYIIPAMVQRGMLQPLRFENLPNFKHIDPRFAGTEFDPGNRHTVPIAMGTAGFLMRKTAGIDPSWSLIFDPARQPGPFLLMEDARACIDAAMNFLGYQPNGTDSRQLAEAGQLLVQAKGRSAGFAIPATAANKVLSREVVLAMCLSSDAARVMKEDPALEYFIPREGGGKWMDNLAIPSGAPNRDLAEKFINYMMDPKVSARFVSYNLAGTPNLAALELLKPEDRNSPAIYPPRELWDRLWFGKDLGEHQKLYDELWTQIKAK